ncbi:MAG: right-handed parallel beta-helix repeat-containing protein [Actinomycetota bacterium]
MRLRLALVAAVVAVAAMTSLPPAMAAGTTHHVSPLGSDAAYGDSGHPWATLQHAVDSIEPGDTIVVHPGTYAGMRIERSGAPGAWITLTAAIPGTVTIDRPGSANRHESNVELETWEDPGTVSYWVIDGLEVVNAPSWGIDVRGTPDAHSHDIVIRANDVHDNGLAAIRTGIFFAFTDEVRVTRNDSHHNGEHGIYLSNSGDGFRVDHNHLHDNGGCGLHMNGDLSQGGDGIISNGEITANLIEGNGILGCAGINLDGVTDATIANNVIVENHASGIAVFRGDGAVCSRDVTIVNNTVVQAADGRWAVVMGGPGCRDVTLVDNVLLTRHPWRGVVEMPTPSLPGLVSGGNVVTGRFTTDGGDTVLDLPQWQVATAQDGDSLAASIDAVLLPGSYRHRPGGPAEDAGRPTGTVTDYDRVPRPSGAGWDSGAFETPVCAGRVATIVGTNAADELRGTPGSDVIVGLAGGDVIRLGAGDDVACGGRGPDRISGGSGGDRLHGEQGDDVLTGGTGTDVARGGVGADQCVGVESVSGCEP